MKGTRNLSKKSAIPASIPKENQRRIKKRTRLSAEGINERRLCTRLEKFLCQRIFCIVFWLFYMYNRCCTIILYYSDSFKNEMCSIDLLIRGIV